MPIIEWVQLGLSSAGYKLAPLMIDDDLTELFEHGVAVIQALWRRAMEQDDD